MEPVEFIISGNVAVDDAGARIGKGEGYSDLDFAVLREFGLVDDDTVTVTTVQRFRSSIKQFLWRPTGHANELDIHSGATDSNGRCKQ